MANLRPIVYCLALTLILGRAYAQSPKVDSLLQILPKEVSDTRFDILGKLFCEVSKYDLIGARKYVDLRHDDALHLRDSFKLCEDYIEYGHILRVEGKYEESEATLFKALGIAERNEYQHKKKLIYNHLGLMAGKLGAYDKALGYHFKSLELRIAEGKLNPISVAYDNIGNTYNEIRDYHKAKEFILKAYKAKIRTDQPWLLGVTLSNLVDVYYTLGEYDSAMLFAQKGKLHCSSNCSSWDNWGANRALGTAYLGLGDPAKAELYFQKSLDFAREMKDSELAALSLFSLAKTKFKQNQY